MRSFSSRELLDHRRSLGLWPIPTIARHLARDRETVPSTSEHLTPAAETLMQLVPSGSLVHEDDAELGRQVGRLVAKQRSWGWVIGGSDLCELHSADDLWAVALDTGSGMVRRRERLERHVADVRVGHGRAHRRDPGGDARGVGRSVR